MQLLPLAGTGIATEQCVDDAETNSESESESLIERPIEKFEDAML